MRLLKDTISYSGLSFAQKGIGFFLLPVYTACLTPSDYGVINVVGAVVGFLTIFYPLGSEATLVREYFPGKEDRGNIARIWGTLLLLTIFFGVLMTFFLSVTHRWILDRVTNAMPFWPFLALGLLMALCSPLRGLYGCSLQVRQRASDYIRLEGGFVLCRLALLLIALLVFRWKAPGALLAFAISELFFAVIALGLFNKDVEWTMDLGILGKSLAYSLPLVPYGLAGWTTSYLGSLVLNYFESTHAVGIYSMAANFALIQTFVVTGFHQAFYPHVFQGFEMATPEAWSNLRRKAVLATWLFATCGVGLSLFGREVLMLMTKPAFWEASRVIPLLVLAGFFQGIYVFYSLILSYHKKATPLLPITAICGAIVSLVAMLFLIPRYSIMGASAAICLGTLGRLLCAVFFCKRRFHVPWPGGSFLLFSIFLVFGCLSVGLLNEPLRFSWDFLVLKIGTALGLSCIFAFIASRSISLKQLIPIGWFQARGNP